MLSKEEAIKERTLRELEEQHKPQRESLVEFIRYFFKHEKGRDFDDNWHYNLLEEKLKLVLEGKITRMIINIPPGSGKTELITKCFPVWALGRNPRLNICATGYSTALTQTYSGEARDYYNSLAFRKVFPRRPILRDDQNTKEWWGNTEGGGYYATGTGGSITGRRFNIFIIDDPLKPDEAESDLKRVGINNWYDNTVLSRLYNPMTDAVIVIMQRTHEDDLCGYLMSREEEGTGEKWHKVILPAIAEIQEPQRSIGEPLQKNRYPLEALDSLKKSLGNANFECQYQQNPIGKGSQEFFLEWFRYHDNAPTTGRIFTAVDPAFTEKLQNDETAIVTGKFIADRLYILEVSHGRWLAGEMEDEVIRHITKWKPEKVGVEAIQAQTMIVSSLQNRLRKNSNYTQIEEIRQTGEKEAKIRKLCNHYRNGLISHPKDGTCDELERQLLKFPRGKHDDIIDAEQMLYNLYELQPNTGAKKTVSIKYDNYGRPQVTTQSSYSSFQL